MEKGRRKRVDNNLYFQDGMEGFALLGRLVSVGIPAEDSGAFNASVGKHPEDAGESMIHRVE